MWGRESFIYLTTRAPDVFHSQFACCGRCHSPRIESRILLPLAAALVVLVGASALQKNRREYVSEIQWKQFDCNDFMDLDDTTNDFYRF